MPQRNPSPTVSTSLPPAARHDDGHVGGVWGGVFVGPIAQILAGPGRNLTNSAAGSTPLPAFPVLTCNPQDGTCRLRQSTITSHSSNRHFVTPLSQLARLPASKAGKVIPHLPRHKPFLTAHIYQTAQLCLYANPNHVKIPS